MKKLLTGVLVLALLFTGGTALFAGGQGEGEKAASGEQEQEVAEAIEVLHWWTSGGEAAALKVLKEKVEAEGIKWVDTPVAGGSGVQAMTVLRSRVTAGNPPAAVQMLGYNILDWAEMGVVANLNPLAEKENWDQVIPDAIKKFSKYEGKWIAAPVNVHSENWVWANTKICNDLDIELPITSWEDYVTALEKVDESGKTALAMGGKPWQITTAFESVVLATGGPDFYEKTMNTPFDMDAVNSDTMVKAFERMETLRQYVDENFSGRDWNLATSMVINGEAAFQMMGDFAKGEFFRADQVPGEDFTGFRTPGTKGSVTFNSDQFVMFEKGSQAKKNAQKILAKNVMDPEFQIKFNTVKGSVPARTDVSDDEFTVIGKEAMKDLAEANDNGTLFGSLAHGHGAPASVKGAIFDVVSAHFNGEYSAEEAAAELEKAIKAAQ
jgi:glucose/mannose transport system substrate-binding protein